MHQNVNALICEALCHTGCLQRESTVLAMQRLVQEIKQKCVFLCSVSSERCTNLIPFLELQEFFCSVCQPCILKG